MEALWGIAVGLILLLSALWLLAKPPANTQNLTLPSGSEAGYDERSTVIGPLIFSEADWIFVNRLQNPEVRRMFLLERRRVARRWLGQVALETRKIMSDHARLVRASRKLNVQTELTLLSRYFALVVCCRGLSVALYVAAPIVFGRQPLRVNEWLGDLSRIHLKERAVAEDGLTSSG